MRKPTQKHVFWAKHIQEWRQSGLTQSAYCKPLKLKPYQLSYWVNNIKELSQTEKDPASSSGFAAVNISQSTVAIQEEELTLIFAAGITLSGINASNITAVKAIVEMFKWPKKTEEIVTLTGQQMNWLLDGYDVLQMKPHKKLNYESYY